MTGWLIMTRVSQPAARGNNRRARSAILAVFLEVDRLDGPVLCVVLVVLVEELLVVVAEVDALRAGAVGFLHMNRLLLGREEVLPVELEVLLLVERLLLLLLLGRQLRLLLREGQ